MRLGAVLIVLVSVFPTVAIQGHLWAQDTEDIEAFEPTGFARSPFVEVRGQVFVDQPRQLTDPIEIRLLDQNTVVREYAHAFGSGHFVFKRVPSIGVFYIDIAVEGFEPVRRRLDGATLAVGPFLTFLLRTERLVVTTGRVEAEEDVVDLRQLQADISDDAREAYEQSLVASAAGDYPAAIALLEMAVELSPEYSEAHNNLGNLYLRVGRYRDGEASLERASELNPNSFRPLLNLGTLFVQEGDVQSEAGQEEQARVSFERGVEVLERAIALDPLFAQSSYYLGTALYKTGAYDESEAVLYRALDLDPQIHAARLVLMNVYTRLGDLNAALDQAETFLAMNPESPQRAGVEQIKQQIEQALNP